MQLYETGLDHLRDEIAVLEHGMRVLIADFVSKEIEGQTPMSMRGLHVNAADIERSFQGNGPIDDEDALASFRQLRLQVERDLLQNINDSLSEGARLPFAYLSWNLRLSTWERRCILLCLAAEIDSRYESWFGYLNNDVTLRVPTAELALRLLGDSEADFHLARTLLAGFSILGRFVLRSDKAAVLSERSMLKQPLRMDPRIISFLLETEKLDSRIADVCLLFDGSNPASDLAFNLELHDRMLQAVQLERTRKETETLEIPFIQLSGPSGAGKKLHARHLAQSLEQSLLLVKLDKLARDGDALADQLKHIVRESLISGALLCFDEGEDGGITSDGWPLQQERIRLALTS